MNGQANVKDCHLGLQKIAKSRHHLQAFYFTSKYGNVSAAKMSNLAQKETLNLDGTVKKVIPKEAKG